MEFSVVVAEGVDINYQDDTPWTDDAFGLCEWTVKSTIVNAHMSDHDRGGDPNRSSSKSMTVKEGARLATHTESFSERVLDGKPNILVSRLPDFL